MGKNDQKKDEHIDLLIKLLARHREINSARIDPELNQLSLSFCLDRKLHSEEKDKFKENLNLGLLLYDDEANKSLHLEEGDRGGVTQVRLEVSLGSIEEGFIPFFIELLTAISPASVLKEKTGAKTLEFASGETDKIWGFCRGGRVKVIPCR